MKYYAKSLTIINKYALIHTSTINYGVYIMNKKYVVVEFESVWDDGVISTEAKYDYINNQIFDIVLSNDTIELNGLVCENIIYNNESYELDEDSDNEYLLCQNLYNEFKNNNPKLFVSR